MDLRTVQQQAKKNLRKLATHSILVHTGRVGWYETGIKLCCTLSTTNFKLKGDNSSSCMSSSSTQRRQHTSIHKIINACIIRMNIMTISVKKKHTQNQRLTGKWGNRKDAKVNLIKEEEDEDE